MIDRIVAVLITACLAEPSCAKEFSINDADQANVLGICQIASRSAAISIEDTAAISQFCLGWKVRMQKANSESPELPSSPVPLPKPKP